MKPRSYVMVLTRIDGKPLATTGKLEHRSSPFPHLADAIVHGEAMLDYRRSTHQYRIEPSSLPPAFEGTGDTLRPLPVIHKSRRRK